MKCYYYILIFPLNNRSLSPSAGEGGFVHSTSHPSFDSHSLPRRALKSRMVLQDNSVQVKIVKKFQTPEL